jgi:hypothetical protein
MNIFSLFDDIFRFSTHILNQTKVLRKTEHCAVIEIHKHFLEPTMR